MKAAKLVYIGAMCFAAALIVTSRADSDKSVSAEGTYKKVSSKKPKFESN